MVAYTVMINLESLKSPYQKKVCHVLKMFT